MRPGTTDAFTSRLTDYNRGNAADSDAHDPKQA